MKFNTHTVSHVYSHMQLAILCNITNKMSLQLILSLLIFVTPLLLLEEERELMDD